MPQNGGKTVSAVGFGFTVLMPAGTQPVLYYSLYSRYSRYSTSILLTVLHGYGTHSTPLLRYFTAILLTVLHCYGTARYSTACSRL